MKSKMIIKVVVFFSLLALIITGCTKILTRKVPYAKMVDFYEEQNDFDVLFAGSSHMMNAIAPAELWQKYGIVAYNIGNSGEVLPTTYHNLVLAMRHHQPKIVVLDTYAMVKSMQTVTATDKVRAVLRDSLGSYPVSYEKYQAIKDLFRDDFSLDVAINYLFDFPYYHSRWDELIKSDFSWNKNYEKGAVSKVGVMSKVNKLTYDQVEPEAISDFVGAEYLKKTIELCKERNIKVILTHLPYTYDDKYREHAAWSKSYQEIADQYQVDYVNFLALPAVIDERTDYFDKGEHVNPAGMKKISQYMGEYLRDKAGVENHHNDEKYAHWRDDYHRYVDYKITLLRQNSSKGKMEEYLMMLVQDDDIDYQIEIGPNYQRERNATIAALLDNLVKERLKEVNNFPDQPSAQLKITTWDKRNGQKIEEVYY